VITFQEVPIDKDGECYTHPARKPITAQKRMHDKFSIIKYGFLGVAGPAAGWAAWLSKADSITHIAANLIGGIVGIVSLWKLLHPKKEKPVAVISPRLKPSKSDTLMAVGILAVLLLGTSGCTFARKHLLRVTQKADTNQVALSEEVKANNTAAVDALYHAPTNRATNLAISFTKRNQQILGLPLTPFDVEGMLSDNKEALREFETRFDHQEKLMQENAAIQAELNKTKEQLVEMGKKYEAEHNQNIVSRVWHWALSTLGIGGLIALCVFCPAVIPIFARILAWIVSKVPSIAGAIGVVSTKAFDAVVVGVQNGKAKLEAGGNKDALHTELAKALDIDHKALVDARKAVLV
jgi:hypothetical protein